MKNGLSIENLAAEVIQQNSLKKDFVADTRAMTMSDSGRLFLNNTGDFGINSLCHEQIATRIGIPKKYYDRMLIEAPALLADNVNHWFGEKPERRLLRTNNGTARAFLSDRYRQIDNFDLMAAVMPVIKSLGCRVESSQLTERHMYLKVVTDRIQVEVKKGDVVQAGLVISNSEVGCGSVRVEPLAFFLSCLNGMISQDYAMKKYHVGRGAGDTESDAYEFFKDSTRRADDRAFFLKVRDIVEGSFNEANFRMITNKLLDATKREIRDPLEVVEKTTKLYELSEEEKSGILKRLIEGADLSQYGLSAAITRHSQDIEDYERATEFERLGGQIIELSNTNWASLN